MALLQKMIADTSIYDLWPLTQRTTRLEGNHEDTTCIMIAQPMKITTSPIHLVCHTLYSNYKLHILHNKNQIHVVQQSVLYYLIKSMLLIAQQRTLKDGWQTRPCRLFTFNTLTHEKKQPRATGWHILLNSEGPGCNPEPRMHTSPPYVRKESSSGTCSESMCSDRWSARKYLRRWSRSNLHETYHDYYRKL